MTVADTGSFHKAAEAIFISPPAVIKQINQLEAELKVQLFVRTHRGLQLTAAGRVLYRDARYIIDYCNASVDRVRSAAQNENNVIRIGTSPMTPVQGMTELWARLQTACPGMQLKLVPFENTPENAREILRNLGEHIDVVAGIADEQMLRYRECAGFVLCHLPLCCAVSVNHRLANRQRLTIQDLYGENLLLIHRGWSQSMDRLRDDLQTQHPMIRISDFDFYNLAIFNQCAGSSDVLVAIENWEPVHPLLKILPVDWSYTIPFGFLHAPEPSETVQRFLDAMGSILSSQNNG